MFGEKTQETLNSILRGEISAVETYAQVLDSEEEHRDRVKIKELQSNHKEAVNMLQRDVLKLRESPETGSGAWGALATAVTGAAKVFGEKPALAALKQGEQYGLKQYEDALLDDDVPQWIKLQFANRMIPNQKLHISMLEAMIDSE